MPTRVPARGVLRPWHPCWPEVEQPGRQIPLCKSWRPWRPCPGPPSSTGSCHDSAVPRPVPDRRRTHPGRRSLTSGPPRTTSCPGRTPTSPATSRCARGTNGKIYVGTAAYGFNAYLVEFDPKTGKQRIVLDVNKVVRPDHADEADLRGAGEDPHAQLRRARRARSTSAASRATDAARTTRPTTPAATSWSTTPRPTRPRTSACRSRARASTT